MTSATEPRPVKRSERSPGNAVLVVAGALFLVVMAVFYPALQNGFQSWYGDDPLYVTDNSNVNTGLTLKNIEWAFTSTDRSNWHPLTWMSHMLDCQLFGLKPWGHHLTSVLFHCANVVLLFFVLQRMTGALWRSATVALLFGIHPLRVESVAWIAERKDVLSAFFWTLTILLYVYYTKNARDHRRTKLFYALTLVSFALALLSKAMVVTLPCVLLLLDYWPLKRWTRSPDSDAPVPETHRNSAAKLLLEKAPMFLLVAATSALTYITQKSWGFLRTYETYPVLLRLENALVSYAKYLGNMFWPANLCSFYPHPGKWPMTVVLASTAVIVIGFVLAFLARRKRPYVTVGWLWYLGTLVPVIGLVQLADQAMADRYTYIPMAGILVAAVWGAHECSLRWRVPRTFWIVLILTLSLPCVALTRRHIATFKDGVTRWQHNLSVANGDLTLAHYALGMSLDDQGRTEEAIQHMEAALRADPKHAQMHMNVATMLQKLGRHDQAIGHYREAVKIEPHFSDARYNLAMSLAEQGQTEESSAELKESVRLNPNDARAYNSLGSFAAQAGLFNEAITYFQQAVRAKPDYSEAHHNLGLALMDSGRKDEAIKHFQEALRLDPTATDTRQWLESLQQSRPTIPTP